MLGMDPKMMVGLLKSQGIEAEEVKAEKAVLELDGKRIEMLSPQITLMRMKGSVSYTISALEANMKEGNTCKKQKE